MLKGNLYFKPNHLNHHKYSISLKPKLHLTELLAVHKI